MKKRNEQKTGLRSMHETGANPLVMATEEERSSKPSPAISYVHCKAKLNTARMVHPFPSVSSRFLSSFHRRIFSQKEDLMTRSLLAIPEEAPEGTQT